MDLNRLRHFALVIQHGGFSAAARETRVPKAKLSRHVMELEEHLGVRLLQRSTRRLALTEAGRIFYEHCAAMVEQASAGLDALEQLRIEPAGLVRLWCPHTIAQIHMPTLTDFMRLYPKLRIEVHSGDRIPDLIEDRIDVALHVFDFKPHSDLVVRRIRASYFLLVASPRYLASRPLPEHPEDLTGHDLIGNLSQGPEDTWDLQSAGGREYTLKVRPRLLITDTSLQHLAAVNGAGIALLPMRVVWGDLVDGTLQRVAPGWTTKEFQINVAYLSRRGMLPAVRKLVDHLVERIEFNVQDFKRQTE